METHPEEKEFSSGECSNQFDAKSPSVESLKIDNDENPDACPAIGREENQNGPNTIHVEEKPVVCAVEGEEMVATERNLYSNINVGEKSFICTECSKNFVSESSLKEHMLLHTNIPAGEKPFVCDECNKSFRWKKNLKRHMKIHAGEKPVVCNVCEKQFSRRSDMKRHLKIHERRFICHLCERCFERILTLEQHIVEAHPAEKEYSSGECSNQFDTKSPSVENLKIDNDGNPMLVLQSAERKIKMNPIQFTSKRNPSYVLLKVRKWSATETNLYSHINGGEKSFICTECSKNFVSEPSLKEHMLSHTNIPAGGETVCL